MRSRQVPTVHVYRLFSQTASPTILGSTSASVVQASGMKQLVHDDNIAGETI